MQILTEQGAAGPPIVQLAGGKAWFQDPLVALVALTHLELFGGQVQVEPHLSVHFMCQEERAHYSHYLFSASSLVDLLIWVHKFRTHCEHIVNTLCLYLAPVAPVKFGPNMDSGQILSESAYFGPVIHNTYQIYRHIQQIYLDRILTLSLKFETAENRLSQWVSISITELI